MLKKKYIRKSLAFTLVLVLLLVSFSSNVFAMPQLINQTVEKQNITSGVVLEKYDRFTTNGWLRTNVLRVDLTNENVKVDSIVNKSGLTAMSPVKTLAKTNGAVAAVNGSFFDMDTGATYGPIMSNGQFDIAASRNNTDMATLALDNSNNPILSYLNVKVELITPTGDRKPIAAYNRYNGFYNMNMYIVDSKWGSITPGVTKTYPNWLEMVVEDGVVKEFSKNKPGVAIPKNGFVVLATMGQDTDLEKCFKVGDPVTYEVTTNIDTNNLGMALTGGTILVKDGKVLTNFTHQAAGNSRQPRTAAGITADGKTLIIAAVDGRQPGVSIGLTQAEMAEYMKELGCANAINYDGGGSTTLVARQQGDTGISTVNTPSDGFERGVSASLGVFSVGEKGPAASLLVSAYEDYVFVNTSRAFTATGVDKYLNPVEINSQDIEWSVSGVKGTFTSNVFTPTTAGQAIITAKIGDSVIGTCPITVLSAPVKLSLNVDTLNTAPGATTTFAVRGWDKNGFSASIHPSHVKWGVLNKVGTISSNVFTAGNSGTGYVSASFGGASVFCPVSISQPGVKKIIEDFNNKAVMSVDLSAKTVTAKYDAASNVYKSGPYSGKLTYDFTKGLEQNRAAYINLPDGGKALDSTTAKLGVWVYSGSKKPLWIGAMIHDKKGNTYYKYFTKDVNWTGWKYLELSLEDIPNPTKVSKIYAVQTSKKKASGTLYFDNLTMVYSGHPEVPPSKSAVNTLPKDDAYKERSVSGSDSLSFSVFGQSTAYDKDKNKTQLNLLNSLASKINKSMQASVLVGTHDGLWQSLKVPMLSTTSSYKAIDKNGNRLIQLQTTKGGLRATSYNEWFWFKKQLSTFTGNNLFIFLAQDPSNFDDPKEGKVLKDMLVDYKKQNPDKNVWVFYKGSTNSSYMDRGVKYITTAGFDADGFSDKNKAAAKYVSVKVKGNTITYQFKALN